MPTPRLHHIGITVSDLDAALTFYQTAAAGGVDGPYVKSGPAVEAATGYPGVEILQAFVTFPEGDSVIELLEYRNTSGARIDPDNGSIGAAHPALVVAAIDKTLTSLHSLGYDRLSEPMTATSGPLKGWRCVYVLGPDRVRVELLQAPEDPSISGTEATPSTRS